MNSLSNKLALQGMQNSIATVLTRVIVDANDPGFAKPTKPVGPFYNIEVIDTLAKALGFSYIEDSGRGYRKVVASPKPVDIVEIDLIREILATGRSVIAAGGGEFPVVGRITANSKGSIAGHHWIFPPWPCWRNACRRRP